MQNVLTPKLSVIITVYNTEKYITDCLQSVINQSFENFEIIVSDGGCSDKTMDICHSFAQKYTDKSFTFVKANGTGPADSRNCGMAAAKGEYITFVDGDDVIDLDMYNKLMQQMDRDNLDGIYCTCYRFFDDDINNKSLRNIQENFCVSQKEIADKMILPLIASTKAGVEIAGSMCMAVYRRNIIEENRIKVRSMEEVFSEDNFFNIEFLSCAERAKTINQPLYFYRRHSDSISNKVHPFTVSALKRFAEYTGQICEKLGIDAKEAEKRNCIRFMVTFSALVKKQIDVLPLKELKKYLKNTVKENDLDFKISKEAMQCAEFQVKLFWLLMRFKMYTVLYLLVKIYSKFITR